MNHLVVWTFSPLILYYKTYAFNFIISFFLVDIKKAKNVISLSITIIFISRRIIT